MYGRASLGVSIRRVFEIKAVDSDFFEEYLEL